MRPGTDAAAPGGHAQAPQFSLKDFMDCYPPPQTGVITSGLQNVELDRAGVDLAEGAVLRFHRQANQTVTLSYQDRAWGGGHVAKVTLPLDCPAFFQVLPYDPVSGDCAEGHTYQTVEQLAAAFPLYAVANRAYSSPFYPDAGFEDGAVLKLLRPAVRGGQRLLEVRLWEQARVMHLPPQCVGDFTAMEDLNTYQLADLLSMPARRRRLRLADEDKQRVPGLPPGFTGDLYLEEEAAYLEASPLDEPELVIGLPLQLDVMVTPEQGVDQRGLLLNTFASNHKNQLPLVARVTDWDEETTILENHFVRPGVELVVHGWTRQSKVLARAAGRFYAIPLTYRGSFRLRMRQFQGVAALARAYPGDKVKVVRTDAYESVSPIAIGDVLRVKHAAADDVTEDERYLRCDKIETGGRSNREVRLALSSAAVFEEVPAQDHDFVIKELLPLLTEAETVVEVVGASPDQRHPDRDLPAGAAVTLSDMIVEPAVYVSLETTDTPAFHVPLRTLLYLSFVRSLHKDDSPLLTRNNPKLSTLDRCVELLPPEIFESLHPNEVKVNGVSTEVNGDGEEAVRAPVHYSTGMPTNWTTAQVQRPGHSWSQGRREMDSRSESGLDTRRSHGRLQVRRGRSTENIYRGAELSLPRASDQALRGRQAELQDAQVRQVVSNSDTMRRLVSASGTTRRQQHVVSSPESNGYVLMPVSKRQPVVPPGYMLVPVVKNEVNHHHQVSQPQRTLSTPSNPLYVARARSAAGSVAGSLAAESLHSRVLQDFDEDDGRSTLTRSTLSRAAPRYRVAVPRDGNLYHLSARKMADLLRQVGVDEASVRACAGAKIDGKKFARMSERDLERYGLLNPVMLHFRQNTTKLNPNFML